MTLQGDAPPERPKQLRVVIADDHPFYRDGLARLLRDNDIDVVAEVPNGRAALDAHDRFAPDVMVMDLNMPGLSGIEATRELLKGHPDARVLVLTVSTEEADVTEAIFAGATGYVLKDAPIEEVVAGIRAAANGQSMISPRIATQLLRRIHEEVRGSDARSVSDLSTREIQVLTMLAAGRANHEIAASLHISEGTVRHHISSILDKLQVDNRVQAAVRAVREGLV
jgi:DNA-binding NarL/FixJ family response regulator